MTEQAFYLQALAADNFLWWIIAILVVALVSKCAAISLAFFLIAWYMIAT